MDRTGCNVEQGRGRGRGRSTSSSSSQSQKKDQAVLGFPCKKPVRLSRSLKPRSSEKSSKTQIDGRSEKVTAGNRSLLLGAPTPEKKCNRSSSRVKNRGVAMSVKEVVNQARQQLQSSNDFKAHANRNQRSMSISAPLEATKTTDFSLPDKHAMLAEFFNSMEAAIRLLRLRKTISSFCNICPQVETMTRKRFMYSHVAQMKHILPEGMLLEKIMAHDEKTLCMKPDLKITLLHDAVLSGKDKVSKANDTLGLRKAFRMRLLEFAEAHPKGDDVPEAILPEPFNRKCHLTSAGCSPLPPIICNSLSSARGVVSSPPDHHQGEPQPSMMSSLLPKNFQRRFSQRNSTAQPSVNSPFPVPEQEPDLNPLSEVPETVKPVGFDGVHPSSLHSHLSPVFESHFAVKFSPPKNTQDIKESNEIECQLSTCNKTHLESQISKSCCTVQLTKFRQSPSKTPNPEPVAEGTIDVDTPCKTAPVSENADPPMPKGYFSPVTPRVSRHSAVKTPVVKSTVKSNIKSPISKKSLRFGSVSVAPDTSSPVLSPKTPGSRFSQPTVKNSNNTNVKRAIAFNRPAKDSSDPACELSGIRSFTLKRKAEEANLDDGLPERFQSPQPPLLSTPAKSSERHDYVDSLQPSPLRAAANPFAISKKNEKIMQNPTCSPQCHRKAFSLENTPVKGVLDTPPLHAPKRLRFSVDEPLSPQVQATGVDIQESGKIDINGMSKSDWQLLQSLPMHVLQEVRGRELKTLEECKLGASAARRRQQMIGCLPKLFNMIRDIFRLSKRSVLTSQELVHKIISNHTDVTDRSEVEEQLHLLQELAPEWISGRKASTGDFVYSVKSNIDLPMIHTRFASAS